MQPGSGLPDSCSLWTGTENYYFKQKSTVESQNHFPLKIQK